MNKQNLKTLALTPSRTNLFLALSIAKGMGCVEDVLEWWWEERKSIEEQEKIGKILGFGEPFGNSVGLFECFFCPVQIEILNEYWETDISIHVFPTEIFQESIFNSFMLADLPPLPTIIQNIKDYTFALILHLWEFGEL